MERKISFSQEEFYHLYNRGVNKSTIFVDSHDYWRFIFLLYLCNSEIPVRIDNILRNEQGLPLLKIQELVFMQERGEQLVSIGAYCLMPNHFHILVRARKDCGISKFMLKLSTAYSMYFNKRHARTGAFFEGPFRAEHVQGDTYLKYLYAYIHLNPIKLIDSKWKENGIKDSIRAEKFLRTYKYSSYLEYAEGIQSRESKILSKSSFPKYFLEKTHFRDYIHAWMNYSE